MHSRAVPGTTSPRPLVDGWDTNRHIERFRQLWTDPRPCD